MIKPITDRVVWNEFVTGYQPNTFLHSWEWGQVQKATGEEVQYLGWYAADSTLAGVTLVITVNARRGRHYLIPHGPLIKSGTSYTAILTELITHLRATAAHDQAVCLRVAPLIETSDNAQNMFEKLNFRPAPLHMHAELTWVLDITAPAEQLLADMRKTTRHAIRRAEQVGVTCEVIIDPMAALKRFWPLYEQTRQRHGFVLWPKKMVQAQLEIFSAANQIFSVIARHNNEDVAAAILPHFGGTVFYYHGASKKLPSAVPAAQLLQWAAIQEAQRRRATHYNFWGIAPENEPNHPFAGLTTFKKGFGGQAINYLHAQDLPLSLHYWQLWAIDTFRKYRRGF